MLLGFLLAAISWLGLRLSVRAQLRPLLAMLLDFGVVLIGWGLFLSLTARPILAALVVIGLAIGLVVVDQVKRVVLREPVLFADRAELVELVRHPRLYLPFAGTGRVLAGAGAIAAGFVTLLVIEPPAWRLTPLPPILGIATVLTLFTLPTHSACLGPLQRLYRRLGPSLDPVRDARRFGLLAGFVIHATLARAERPSRLAGLAPCRKPRAAPAGAIVLVQAESFFDVARLDPALADRVLPGFTACRAAASQAGRLAVPCFGANTIRSEFAVLTGLDESRLGFDRYNPYARFAQAPIDGIAWRARAAGWRTVCVHPFDLSFYDRRRVLPLLGFETLIGAEAFTDAPRGGHYVSDEALAGRIAALLDAADGEGRGILIFAITMETHGPWDAADPAATLCLPPTLAGIADAAALSGLLFRMRAADRAIPVLRDALSRRAGGGVLAVYGDHQPSLPKAFAAIGLDDDRTDYFIWRSDAPGGGQRRDLAAHDLGAAVGKAAGLPV